jgi:hypothetical protein
MQATAIDPRFLGFIDSTLCEDEVTQVWESIKTKTMVLMNAAKVGYVTYSSDNT